MPKTPPPEDPPAQGSLFDVRGMVHAGDPETSRRAAERVQARLTELQARVLALLDMHGPMTDDELYRAYIQRYGPTAYVTPAKRRGELRDQGRVSDSGQRRVVPTTGSMAVVWRLGPPDPELG